MFSIFSTLFSATGSKAWQIAVVILVVVVIALYASGLKKDTLIAKKETEKAELEADIAKQSAERQQAAMKAQEDGRKRVQTAQKRIDEAVKESILPIDNSTTQKPNIGERAQIWILLIALFGLTACTPKTVTVTEYIHVKEPLPEMRIIPAPERNLPFPLRTDEDSYVFTWAELMQVRGYIFSLEGVVQRHEAQLREYNEYRAGE